jgi:ABC-type transport system involved in multi-copper enzyme maturation permease subunit
VLGLKSLLGWEFKNLVRFPLLELLVVMVVYLSMLSTAGGSSLGLSAQSSWSRYPEGIARDIMFHLVSDVEYLYVPTILSVTVFASIGIAREVEAGFVKVALSYPIRRRDLFLVKFGCCFLTSLAIFAIALFSAMFLKNWTATLYILSFPSTILLVLCLLVYQTFYAASVATAVAVFSRNTAASFIGSIGILYMPVYMAQMVRLRIPCIPPESTSLFSFYMKSASVFWEQYGILTLVEATVVPVVIALALLFLSFFYFTWRYDLS